MKYREERYMVITAILAAILVASHSPFQGSPWAVAGTYLYWLTRIGTEALLFFVVRGALETYLTFRQSSLTALAIVLSHLPFVLVVTAMDIVLGFPELGMAGQDALPQPQVRAFAWELLVLADNHIALCLILSVPRWIMARVKQAQPEVHSNPGASILDTLEPPLTGTVLWLEAQEHYVRVTTDRESRMVLARFSDVLRDFSAMPGMQVHRSHWVRLSAVTDQEKRGQSFHLTLSTGDSVPVSRSFRTQVQTALNA